MTPLRRRLRRLRFLLQAGLIAVVIAAAALAGFAQLALPWLADNPERIEAWLSVRLQRPVEIGHVQGRWTREGPRLLIDDLRLGPTSEGAAPVLLPQVELALNPYAAFQRNRAWNEFRIVGLDLNLRRDSGDTWTLGGIDAPQPGSGGQVSMGALGAVVLVDLHVEVADVPRGIRLDLDVPELRVVNLGSTTRILGQVRTRGDASQPMALVADLEAGQSGRLYLGGSQLDLAALSQGHALAGVAIPAGKGDFGLWADWSGGRINAITTRFDLLDVVLAARTDVQAGKDLDVQPRTAFDRIAATARWQRQDSGWQLDVANASVSRQGIATPPAQLRLNALTAAEPRYTLQANALNIGALGAIGMLVDGVPDKARRWFYLANPAGQVAALELDFAGAEKFEVAARVEGFQARHAGKVPGVAPLTFALHGDEQAILIELPAQATAVETPEVFRKPFVYRSLRGDVVAWREGTTWQVRTPRLDLDAEDYAVQARGGLAFPADGTRPSIDAWAIVERGNMEAAKLFWPTNVMAPKVVEWLDRALVSGTTTGRAFARGDLDDWPFTHGGGRFEARADLSDLQLAFLADWPQVEKLGMTARFINNGMFVDIHSGTTAGVEIDRADAAIPEFKDADLRVNADAHGAGKALLNYLRATPIGTQHKNWLAGLGIGGQGRAHVELDIPLKHVEDLRLDGHVDLEHAALSERTWALDFTDASGRVAFTRSGVRAEALKAGYEGHPVNLAIAIGSATADPANQLEGSLIGLLPTTAVFGRAADLAPALERFPGQSGWQVDLAIPDADQAADRKSQLSLRSDLVGTSIDLPAPFGKPAYERQPFVLQIDMPPVGGGFSARLGDIVDVRGRLPGPVNGLAARLDFGDSGTVAVPERGLMIGGHVERIDAGAWIGLFNRSGVGGDLLRGIHLDATELELAGRSFPNLHLDVDPGDDATTVRIVGEALDGEIRVPHVDLSRSGVTAHMNRVSWPDPMAAPADAPSALAGIDPASLPPLHLWVGELRLGSAVFGETRLETYPIEGGMHIDRLEAKSPNVDMHASGEWRGTANDNRSQLRIDMTAKSLGSMLDALGFAGVIDGGETLTHLDAAWPGPPSAFALANTTGTLEVSVERGRFLDVDPGAGGRLFGLLSLREIPRRLSLDFSDFFKSGMTFNSIKGRFELRDGNAYTEDLAIASPAADIRISGRTGLKVKDYDQEMLVEPRAGVTLPVVGALAGGPVGAAAGIVMQTLIGKQINKAARSRYHVTGSWEKPVITLIERQAAKAQADDGTNEPGDAAGGGASPAAASPAAPTDNENRESADQQAPVIDPVPAGQIRE